MTRPGIKPGYYVPIRLRVVDSLSTIGWIPTIIGALAIAITAPIWAMRLGIGIVAQNPFVTLACVVVSLIVASRLIWWIVTQLLRFTFRACGLLTAQESEYFPLRSDRERVDPWPECWQRKGEFLSQWDEDVPPPKPGNTLV